MIGHLGAMKDRIFMTSIAVSQWGHAITDRNSIDD
jgi:hypothetical protein